MIAHEQGEKIRDQAAQLLSAADPGTKGNEADYVFITFILDQLPHGVIGLLIAAFFAAALSSKAAELNALGSSTTVDIYWQIRNRNPAARRSVTAPKWLTASWGLVAIAFALCANLAENLVQAVNILGSLFYGVMLGLFVVAFFVRHVDGTAIFWAALVSQTLIFILFFTFTISYLWYPLIGCCACVVLSAALQALMDRLGENSAWQTPR